MADDRSYGLPEVRDREGNLQAVDHTFDWGGQSVTIRFRPPTIREVEDLERFGEQKEVDAEELEGVLDEFMIEPAPPSGDEGWTMREVMCYLEGILDYSTGGGGVAGDIREQVEQELEGGTGN